MQSLEPTYGQDLNGDGTVGLRCHRGDRRDQLEPVADNFYLYAHGTPPVRN